jgi:sugar lactone lactonase YvrE
VPTTRHLRAALLDEAGAVLGEGPLWDARTGQLSWVDILSGRVHVHDADGQPKTTYEVGGHVCSALPAENGGWLLATADGFDLLDLDGAVRPLHVVEADRPEVRFNDAKCDRWGRALAGTMRYDEAPGSATLYRLEATRPDAGDRPPGLVARILLEHLGLANGMGWSPDDRTLYFIDSLTGVVSGFAYADEGGLGPRQDVVVLRQSGAVPDGMCVDSEGGLWVALYGGGAVHRYRPDGRLDTVVSLPVPLVTSVTFGGPGGGRLFITTAGGSGERHAAGDDRDSGTSGDSSGAGGLWAVDPGVGGPPATPWRNPLAPASESKAEL